MSAESRSIGQRLRKASTPALRAEIASDWARNWRRDQEEIARGIEQAVKSGDRAALTALSAQLRAVTDKRFRAFQGVLDALTKSDA